MNPNLQIAFILGVMIAEHAHGINRKENQNLTDEIFRILEKVAGGNLTLINTPEENIASLPGPSPELAAKAPEAVKKLLDQAAATN